MSPSRSYTRVNFSIGQSMVVILIVGLCLAPLVAAARTSRGELILVAVFFDVVALPVVAALLLAATMSPGPSRDWCFMALWITPALFVGAILMLSIPVIILGARWFP